MELKDHYRLIIYLAAYDPYKDIFDIFIEQFKKHWPDCPYLLVIANMYFQYEGENVLVINCGDVKSPVERKNRILDTVNADYYLGFEEDRIIMNHVDTNEIEKILDFMDKENILYYRCNASQRKKKKADKFLGYEHYYHIPANEPYGVCGSTVIWSKKLMQERRKSDLENGYAWEAYHNKRAALTNEKWVENYATDDRNLFHIIHCIEKQKWIRSAYHELKQVGYIIKDDREIQSIKETIIIKIKESFKMIPGNTRHRIKSFLIKLGFNFVTDY